MERSVRFKEGVARRDEREAGERRKLNLGHTIGHAIEAATGIAHGEAVAAGLGAALRLSATRFGGSPKAEERVLALLSSWGLPTSIAEAAALARSRGTRAISVAPSDGALREAIACAIGTDKKRSGDSVLFILPLGIGEVKVTPISLNALRDFVMEAP